MRLEKLFAFVVLCTVLGACANPEDGLAELWHQKNAAATAKHK